MTLARTASSGDERTGRPQARGGVQHARRDQAGAHATARPVHVVQKRLERERPLLETAFQAAPLRLLDQPRDQIDRERPGLPVDGERDLALGLMAVAVALARLQLRRA